MYTQLLCHLFGDYFLQSNWQATNKTKKWFPAITHACLYFIPFFVIFSPSLAATAIIIGTHAMLDRFRLVRYLLFLKEFLAPRHVWPEWKDCKKTGYHKDLPDFLSFWLMVIADNTLHLTINALTLTYL